MSKKVSIIIPARNEEKYLPSCLESISNLNYPKKDIEVIVVDNGSTDNTREIAKSCGATVLCDDSLNVSGLRSLGVAKSTGEIIAFVDAGFVALKNPQKDVTLCFKPWKMLSSSGPKMQDCSCSIGSKRNSNKYLKLKICLVK